MMKLAVCGDSWFSADKHYPGQSFSEILSTRNNWELVNLARNGCSNFTIALQINKAIELGADFVIVGITTADRIEIPIIKSDAVDAWDKLKKLFTWQNWFLNQPSLYDKTRGLSNILYKYKVNPSSDYEFLSDPTIVSESMNNLLFNRPYNELTVEQMDALKQYMLNLYDHKVKQQVDCWILSDACRRLQNANIKFLLCLEALGNDTSDFDWIDKKNKMYIKDFQFGALPRKNSCSFHYCPELGAPVFANYIETRINNLYD